MRRVTARTSLTALCLALAVSFGTGAAPATAGPAHDEPAKRGTLDWGVKQSYREYVEGIAGGGIEVTPPAKRKANGTFRWAKGKGVVNPEDDGIDVTLKGSVYFYGHDEGSGPMLEVTLVDPTVVINGSYAVIRATVISRSAETGELVTYPNLDVADIDTTGLDLEPSARGVVKASKLPTALTLFGAEPFGDIYPPGTPFDKVSFKVKIVS